MISAKVKLPNQSNNPLYLTGRLLRDPREGVMSLFLSNYINESNGIKIVNKNKTATLILHYCLWLTIVSTLTTQHTKVSGRMKHLLLTQKMQPFRQGLVSLLSHQSIFFSQFFKLFVSVNALSFPTQSFQEGFIS